MAEYYIEIMQSIQPEGPYDVGGYCLGGIIAYEISRRLQLAGHDVSSLVMVDSPDNIGFNNAAASSNIPIKSAALQLANTLLWPANAANKDNIVRKMIHQNEVDENLTDEMYVVALAGLVNDRGLTMEKDSVISFINRNIAVQSAYKLIDYEIQSLTNPDSIKCVYFRNGGRRFFGFLESYFQTQSTNFALDNVNYWQEWQREMPCLNIIDVESSSHMSIMYEEPPKKAIRRFCEELYQQPVVAH